MAENEYDNPKLDCFMRIPRKEKCSLRSYLTYENTLLHLVMISIADWLIFDIKNGG
jgi:hypothetical protein